MLSQQLIHQARLQSEKTKAPIMSALQSLYQGNAESMLDELAQTFGYSVLPVETLNQLEPVFQLVPYTEMTRRKLILARDPDNRHFLIIADPFDSHLIEWASANIREPLQFCLMQRSAIEAYLAEQEHSLKASDTVVMSLSNPDTPRIVIENLSLQSISESSSAVIKLVHSTLYDALNTDVSDIHLESEATGMVIKYRIDGVLNVINTYKGREFGEQVISRIKIMAHLDIAEKRIPQDGRFKVVIKNREVDFRVSIMPSIFGEDAVIRILDRHSISNDSAQLRLDQLGFTGHLLTSVRKLITMPYGMFLVTGPTGSGKTTTLYAAISETRNVRDKIVTIEDPVEYQLPGVLQIPVNEKKGLTFARGLRSILRHDPDKIMVGEIRDAETANIAVQSALTGHLVFTTVHANNVFDVIGRFSHMGVDPYSFVSALNGVLAQRLVRKICPHCATADSPSPALLQDSGIDPLDAATYNFQTGKGCNKCRGTGFRGRTVICELLILNDDLRELIVNQAPIKQIKEAAFNIGMSTLRQAALELVRQGTTTLEEVNRVTFVE